MLAYNIEELKASAAWRSIATSFIAGSLLFLVLGLILRDWRRAALLCSLILVLVFSYGHVNQFLKLTGPLGFAVARHRYMVPVWLLAFALGWRLIHRTQNPEETTQLLNVVSIALFLLPLFQLGLYSYRFQTAQAKQEAQTSSDSSLQPPSGEIPPDVYYILLDAYTRENILQEVFEYDNSPFLDALRNMGFYIAPCSQSNYAQTQMSLSSALNMNYLDALGEDFVASNKDRSDLWPLLRHGKVRSLFEEMGYTIVAFETAYYWIMWMDADVYLAPPRQRTQSALFNLGGLNSFEAMYLRSTAALVLTDAALKFDLLERVLPDIDYPRKVWRERTLFKLAQLEFEKVPSIQSPKFVFAHINLPHPPYVFGPNGEYIKEPEDKFDLIAYRNQLTYTNSRILPILKDLVERSERPPVILLQGDHGLRLVPEERMPILNAYYLPGEGKDLLYPTISPVNSFRVVFNTYFGGNFELLEDSSYFSLYEFPYEFQAVPVSESGCEIDLSPDT
jgi:hypothetical protein